MARFLFSVLCFVSLAMFSAPALAQNSAPAKAPAKDHLVPSGTVSERGALLLCSADHWRRFAGFARTAKRA